MSHREKLPDKFPQDGLHIRQAPVACLQVENPYLSPYQCQDSYLCLFCWNASFGVKFVPMAVQLRVHVAGVGRCKQPQ